MDAKGIQSVYQYDVLNRLKSITYPEPENNVSFEYDDTTDNNQGKGQLTSITDASGTTEYRYNRFGQSINDTRTINNKVYSTEYHYNAHGRATGIKYPSGHRLVYHYNTFGQID